MKPKTLYIAGAAVLVAAFVVGTLVYNSEPVEPTAGSVAGDRASLARWHSPTLGNPDAKVHIVEFLDPACETCRAFYPYVKRILAQHPDRIRLTIRHVAFHRGSDHVLRMLEASKQQGKYWEVLEAVLASQGTWVVNHVVQPDRVWSALDGVGLDRDRLKADMHAPEVTRRIEQDLADAKALKVSKTPEYFVNGRPLPSFGLGELQRLVYEELGAAY